MPYILCLPLYILCNEFYFKFGYYYGDRFYIVCVYVSVSALALWHNVIFFLYVYIYPYMVNKYKYIQPNWKSVPRVYESKYILHIQRQNCVSNYFDEIKYIEIGIGIGYMVQWYISSCRVNEKLQAFAIQWCLAVLFMCAALYAPAHC